MIQPSLNFLNQMDQKSLKCIFEFVQFIVHRHFGLILHLSKESRDPSFYLFTLSLIANGLQSTNSTALFCSIECIDSMHNYCIKGSKFYKEALRELLLLSESQQAFMTLVKVNLRSFLRRETTNRGLKMECTCKILNMYRVTVDQSNMLFQKCALDVSSEFRTTLPLC